MSSRGRKSNAMMKKREEEEEAQVCIIICKFIEEMLGIVLC